ncbi:hypothetical protein JCM10207_004545 [Rhodosporidiobolus poonsookiae]
MLTQSDVVTYLTRNPPPEQLAAFSILHAYVYSKSSRGNLPSETLTKLLAIQRKLITRNHGQPLPSSSPVARAFDAMKTQIIAVNRKWHTMGPLAFGPLGAIGATGGNADAQLAWKKATDGKVKTFPDGDGGAAMGWMPGGAGEMDAGRIVEPNYVDSADPGDPLQALMRGGVGAPPGYDAPPPDPAVVQALEDRREEDANGRVPMVGRDSVDDEGELRRSMSPLGRSSIDEGAAHLARLRQLKEEKERRDSPSPSPAPPPIPEEPPAERRE